jgi:hypothetical protein
MALSVDRSAVLAGARLAVLVAVPAIILGQALESAAGGNAVIPLYLVILGGLCAGGRLAALRQPESPLTHGALAALAAYVALIVAIVLIQLALGREVADPVSQVFNGLMAASAGMFGGYLAARETGRAT